jgi:hypothetical protein
VEPILDFIAGFEAGFLVVDDRLPPAFAFFAVPLPFPAPFAADLATGFFADDFAPLDDDLVVAALPLPFDFAEADFLLPTFFSVELAAPLSAPTAAPDRTSDTTSFALS